MVISLRLLENFNNSRNKLGIFYQFRKSPVPEALTMNCYNSETRTTTEMNKRVWSQMKEFMRMKNNYKVLTGSHAVEVDPLRQCVGKGGLQSQDSLTPPCLPQTRIKLV